MAPDEAVGRDQADRGSRAGMRLLVAVDDRDGGRDALELARVLGSGGDAGALVVRVLNTGPLPLDYALLSEEETEPLLAATREKLAGVAVEARAYVGGSPAGILTTLAERDDFDAIVVGSPHRGALGQVLIGSVANSLLNGAPTDVAIAPHGYAKVAHDAPRTIAVGYDGGPEAGLALRRAEALARSSGAGIEILTAVRPPRAAASMAPGVYAPQFPLEPDKVIEAGLRSVDPALAANATRLDGDPATELAAACEEGIDLLVVGSRGYGPVTRVLLGSVARQVAQTVPCPVLVARRP